MPNTKREEKKLFLECIQSRLVQLKKIQLEPAMDDLDLGKLLAIKGEVEFLQELIANYGQPKKGKGNTCS